MLIYLSIILLFPQLLLCVNNLSTIVSDHNTTLLINNKENHFINTPLFYFFLTLSTTLITTLLDFKVPYFPIEISYMVIHENSYKVFLVGTSLTSLLYFSSLFCQEYHYDDHIHNISMNDQFTDFNNLTFSHNDVGYNSVLCKDIYNHKPNDMLTLSSFISTCLLALFDAKLFPKTHFLFVLIFFISAILHCFIEESGEFIINGVFTIILLFILVLLKFIFTKKYEIQHLFIAQENHVFYHVFKQGIYIMKTGEWKHVYTGIIMKLTAIIQWICAVLVIHSFHKHNLLRYFDV